MKQTNRTFNQIIEEFKTFADSHSFLKTFGIGLPTELNAAEDNIYPVMWVVPISGETTKDNISSSKLALKFEIIFGDMCEENPDSISEVLSDTLQTSLDFISYCAETSTFLNVDLNSTLTPWLTLNDNSLTGWSVEINIVLPYYSNPCYPNK